MELRQLEYVVAIADTGSFTRAGHRCHVVQSALSRQVARLETELGVRLFHRTTREVRLTAAGHAFLPAARRVLSEAARARAEATDAASVPRGQLRLGASQAASGSLDLAALLADRGLTMTIGAYRPAEAALPAARAILDVASRRDELLREFA